MKKILFNLFLIIIAIGLFLPGNAEASNAIDVPDKNELEDFYVEENSDQLGDNIVSPLIYLEATRTQNRTYATMAQVPDRIQYSEVIGGLTYSGWLNLVSTKPLNGKYNAVYTGVINVWVD